MKKMFVMFFMLMCVICASAQVMTIVERRADGVMKVDTNGDGKWDTMIDASRVPDWGHMRHGGQLYNELGRAYVVQQWRMYESMGVNPENYLPNPFGNGGNFTQYAGAYQHLLTMGGSYYGGGVPMGGMVGMPGQASVTFGGKDFGFGISVPVRSNDGTMMYTPNATVGVNINGNYLGASVPVSVVTGKNKKQTRTQAAPTTRTQTRTQAAPATTCTQTQTRSQVREMHVDEVAKMLNDSSYM